MDLRNYLTNEKMRKKFVSQFDLVNYAIKLAANMIHTGREEPRVKTDNKNRATQILSEILNGKDRFDDVIARPIETSYSTHKSFEREETVVEESTKAKPRAKDKDKDTKKKRKVPA